MAVMPDSSPYGSQTVTGPGWPNVDEESIAAAAGQYEALAAKLTGSVVPTQQTQLMALSDTWKGGGSIAAASEATTIIGGHESNAAQATAIAVKLRAMEVTVAKTKALVNTTAMETQAECEAISAMPISNTQELVQSRIMMGLSQNIAYVNANSAELAGGLGVPPNIPNPGAPPTAAAQQGSQQGMQMLSQMGQIAGQLGGMLTQAPQQLMQPLQQLAQPLQQLAQPLQQLTSMFGGKGGSAASGLSPFSAFSNHPLAGGAGAGGGAGLVKAASLPGSGGVGVQTPLLASLVGSQPAAVAAGQPTAASAAVGGLAPVAAGGGMGGGMGMMGGARGEGGSGGSAASLSVPAPLDYDLGEDDDDDW